jgi:hypothetical protein
MAIARESRAHDAYLQHRQQLTALLVDQCGKFDRALFVLSSGAIALSLTFFEKIAGSGRPAGILAIWVAWSCFLLCLLLLVLSHWTTTKAVEADIAQLDESLGDAAHKWRTTLWNRATGAMNLGSFVFFFLGAVFFVVFAAFNLGVGR